MVEGSQMPELFQRLFREHYPGVARKLYALTGDYAAAEDLAQEVFLRLYRSPPERLDAVGAWLHRVLTRIGYDYLRQRQSGQALWEKEAARVAAWAEDAAPSGETEVIRAWEKEVVRKVLRKLSDRDRTALLLREEGYSYEEIALRLEVNPKIVGTLLARAEERLKKKYGQEEERSDGEKNDADRRGAGF
ncbi:RNA polymerase sigma factor, sigma-70 family [Paenibacillus sp. UNCCL117]|uniref:sigma-70 family RNA polymerase sigma factor n=1 Tax=unclassified Paenibacillus TaxID=185978 RepID=UPI000883CDA4|nr:MULTISPECIES: sigma-70 family RNA polymerase sigma factor [unclassified Paenibacillus]SDC94220.1 RNA polymerase sigma factor, sigma-70 family [Paenibacillus sp. cl123]SFW29757.1 RNA polymerase sigma factor, sigma-70 family [Paenibacillus sp. UNCCL117]